jgi:hypothetical protein
MEGAPLKVEKVEKVEKVGKGQAVKGGAGVSGDKGKVKNKGGDRRGSSFEAAQTLSMLGS